MDRSAEKIRDIQDSLVRVSNQIQIINKERLREESRIEKVLQMAIPKIKQKIHDSIFEDKKFRTNENIQSECFKRSIAIKERKIIQGLKIARSRNLLYQNKSHESKQIRAMSRLNEDKIKSIRRKEMEDKKRRNIQIKEQMEQSRTTIQNFYQQKQTELQKKRQFEKLEALKTIQGLAKSLAQRNEQKNKIQKKRQSTSLQLEKIKQVISSVNQMRTKEFSQVTEKAGLCAQALSIEEIQNFLQFVGQGKENIKNEEQK